jgi:hypothetical protein
VEFARSLHAGSEWETHPLTLQPDEQLLFLPVKKPEVIELTLK